MIAVRGSMLWVSSALGSVVIHAGFGLAVLSLVPWSELAAPRSDSVIGVAAITTGFADIALPTLAVPVQGEPALIQPGEAIIEPLNAKVVAPVQSAMQMAMTPFAAKVTAPVILSQSVAAVRVHPATISALAAAASSILAPPVETAIAAPSERPTPLLTNAMAKTQAVPVQSNGVVSPLGIVAGIAAPLPPALAAGVEPLGAAAMPLTISDVTAQEMTDLLASAAASVIPKAIAPGRAGISQPMALPIGVSSGNGGALAPVQNTITAPAPALGNVRSAETVAPALVASVLSAPLDAGTGVDSRALAVHAAPVTMARVIPQVAPSGVATNSQAMATPIVASGHTNLVMGPIASGGSSSVAGIAAVPAEMAVSVNNGGSSISAAAPLALAGPVSSTLIAAAAPGIKQAPQNSAVLPDLGEMQAFIGTHDDQPCLAVVAENDASGIVAMTGYGTLAALAGFTAEARAKFGPLLPVDTRAISASQCWLLDMLGTWRRYRNPDFNIVLAQERVASGDKVRATITNVDNNWLYVLLVNDEGKVIDLTDSVLRGASGASLVAPVTATGEGPQRLQLLVAITTKTSLVSIDRHRGEKAEAFFVALQQELKQRQIRPQLSVTAFEVD